MPLEITFDSSLVKLNTMAVPAKAKALVQVDSVEQMLDAIKYAKNQGWQTLILGEGSNTVFTKDYHGLVILNRIMGIEVLEDNDGFVLLRVASGENWHKLVETTVNNGWYGLQNLALIPGLVGAAPMQNIGAYGSELKDTLVSVSYLDLVTHTLVDLDREQCQFSYRSSIFKTSLANQVAISSIVLKLQKSASLNISYPSLAEKLAGLAKPTLKSVFDAVCEIRQTKLPQPEQIPNAGSFFKNPVVERSVYQKLKQLYPDMPGFIQAAVPSDVDSAASDSAAGQVKLAAGWLIEQAGWKDKIIGQVGVHQQQALVIINPQGADGHAVLSFAQAVQKDINEKFGVQLEIEPQLI